MKQTLVSLLTYLLLPLILLFLLFITTNPYQLPLAVLIIPFVLLFIISFQCSLIVLAKLYKTESKRRLRLNAIIIAGGLSVMALLQSIRQLSVQDLIIIVCLIAILSFYARRIDI